MDYGLTVVYPFNGLASLELSYAVTVHKSQGSQAAITIQVYLPHYLLNRRELLYTGLTRGKKHRDRRRFDEGDGRRRSEHVPR